LASWLHAIEWSLAAVDSAHRARLDAARAALRELRHVASNPDGDRYRASNAAMPAMHQWAVVGSMMPRTSVTLLAGKPLSDAC